MRQRSILILLVAVLVMTATLGCSLAQSFGKKEPTATPTYTKTPKPTFTDTPVIVNTPTPIPTKTTPPTKAPAATNTPAQPTATPVPPTPVPTNTPVPKPQGIVNIQDLNFRAGPGTAYGILGTLDKGTKLEVRTRLADNGWVRVCCYKEQEGWVSPQYLDLSVALDKVPVDTAVPPTPTPRPVPPTNTPRPTTPPQPTNTPVPQYYYRSANVSCLPNCGITYIQGTVYEGLNRVNGIIVRLSWQPDGPTVADYVSGTDPGKPGMYTFILEPTKPREGTWYVWVVNSSGQRISQFGQINSTLNCDGSGACQQGLVDFAH